MRAQTRLPLLCAGLVLLSGLAGCGGSQLPADTVRDAKCSGIRVMFERSQTEVIDAGLCDQHETVADCAPHVALREALVLALQENGCGS
jgi:hypothetical protein